MDSWLLERSWLCFIGGICMVVTFKLNVLIIVMYINMYLFNCYAF